MQIVIVGAGAMGSLVGGLLSRAGNDVTLVDIRQDVVDAIRNDGVTVLEPDGSEFTVHPAATTEPTSLDAPDAVLLFVKSTATEAALDDIADFAGPDTLVATLQNGLPNYDAIRSALGDERALGGYSTFGATLEAPGRVDFAGRGENVLGGRDYDGAKRLAQTLSEADLPTEAVEDPRPHIWHKQFVNVAIKPPAVLTGLPDGPLWETDATRRVMELLVEEAVAVAEARGVDVLGDPMKTVETACMENYDKKSSMLIDIERGRQTEIDAITGAVVEYGEEVGEPVPYNRLATLLVKGREAALTE
ncbi:MAG: ketopantoate reductase family protein [Salinirussus sp.]